MRSFCTRSMFTTVDFADDGIEVVHDASAQRLE